MLQDPVAITRVPTCCGRLMRKRSYDYKCDKCGSLCSPAPAVCAHTSTSLGFCNQCGVDVLPRPDDPLPDWACVKCGLSAVGQENCRNCGSMGKVERDEYDRRQRRARVTRADEGWTTTLAKLIGPCGTPAPQRAECRYERYHAPDTICNECDWVGERVHFRARPTVATCPENNLHGAGMTCSICGFTPRWSTP